MNEWTISELHDAYRDGSTDPVAVCRDYLARIEEVDRSGPAINAIIEVNPDALAIAAERTAEIADGGPTGLLHGVPVLLKDNIDTGDAMKTTAGSLALIDAPQPTDAFLVERLRAEGAIILGKTNLSEWANFRSTHSNSGWSSRGGQTRNPYVTDRTPCGSSSGSGAAIAANLAVVAVG
ncbi:MAG: amidase family protein, partial [Spirochaetota bacterium]